MWFCCYFVPQMVLNVHFLVKALAGTIVRLVGLSQNQENKQYMLIFDYAHGGNLEQNDYKERNNWIGIMHLAIDLANC